MRFVSLLIMLCGSSGLLADTLQPFSSDGCSWFPNGNLINHQLWLSCCITHDFAYWKGGTKREKLDADKALKHCVADAGEPMVGELMEMGVRLGGSAWFPTTYRWGYGWPYPREYRPLTEEEQAQVIEQSRGRYPITAGQGSK